MLLRSIAIVSFLVAGLTPVGGEPEGTRYVKAKGRIHCRIFSPSGSTVEIVAKTTGVYPGAVPSYETVASTRVGLNGSYELHAKRIVCTDGCTGSYTVFQLNAFPFCNDGILPPSTPSPKNKKSVDIPETYYLKDKNEKKYFVKDF